MQVHGALLIDKAAGLSSAKVVAKVKRGLGVKKIGHAGTLDPMATGLLVLLLGHATRVQSLFLESEKEYQGEILLGRQTSTDDVTGETLHEDTALEFHSKSCSEALLSSIREEFSGKIQQRPPLVSAIHVNGERSYKRVRKGEQVELAPREVEVEFLELEFIERDRLRYHVRCSKGTYIRSLARDIGLHLSSFGCLESIRRTYSTPFGISQALSFEQLETIEPQELTSLPSFLPLSELLGTLPRFELDSQSVRKLRNGIQEPLRNLQPVEEGLAGVFEVGVAEPVALLESLEQGGWGLRCVFS